MHPRLFTELSTYAGAELQSRTRQAATLAADCEHITHTAPRAKSAAIGLAWDFADWSPDVYVFLPAGAYAGNRQPALAVPYSPRVPEELVAGTATLPYITDVPRLTDGPGPSRIQLKSGDLAFPAFGCFDPRNGRAWCVLAADPAATADWLFEVTESDDRNTATFRIASPGVRQPPVYRMPFLQSPSPDRAMRSADAITVNVRQWDCRDLTEFFDRVLTLRAGLVEGGSAVTPELPFSAAATLIEEHYHRDSWRDGLGLFATDCDPASILPFQTGWCGGMIATYPLLASPDPLSHSRARINLETFFAKAPLPSGFFHGRCTRDGLWTTDFALDAARPYTHGWTLVRRQADALFYLLRQIALLEKENPAWRTPPVWDETLRACAAAFTRLWQRERQFGQFIHAITGEIAVGGSTSGALVPAALVTAWHRFGDAAFLDAACKAGAFFARDALARGLSTGGPGDALQNPDSESIGALVESYAALHAATGDEVWLSHGRAAAALLATWVMPYDFPFPAGTEFARLGIKTRGSVFANTQNKHAAPGICTHSGAGLLHLFRATGDVRLLDLLRDIARFIPQTVSRGDRPIHAKDGRALPSGWINERVNTSDWDDNLGGVFAGSCWCEVSLLLNALELPGIYVHPDLGCVWCLDHVDALLESDGRLVVSNPTAFPARVRVLVETAEEARRPLDSLWFTSALRVDLQPGGLATLETSASRS